MRCQPELDLQKIFGICLSKNGPLRKECGRHMIQLMGRHISISVNLQNFRNTQQHLSLDFPLQLSLETVNLPWIHMVFLMDTMLHFVRDAYIYEFHPKHKIWPHLNFRAPVKPIYLIGFDGLVLCLCYRSLYYNVNAGARKFKCGQILCF